jgi:hypothetical protein
MQRFSGWLAKGTFDMKLVVGTKTGRPYTQPVVARSNIPTVENRRLRSDVALQGENVCNGSDKDGKLATF